MTKKMCHSEKHDVVKNCDTRRKIVTTIIVKCQASEYIRRTDRKNYHPYTSTILKKEF